MYRVGVADRFKAVHALRGDFGEESRPHEHDYRVEWICSSLILDENGFSVNIALLAEALARILEGLQGRDLNRLEFFQDRQSSLENLSFYLQRELFRHIEGRGVPVSDIVESEIRIWESEDAWASYQARQSEP